MNKKLTRGLAIGFFLSGMILFFYPEKNEPIKDESIDQKKLDQLVANEKQLRSEKTLLVEEIDTLNEKITALEQTKITKAEKEESTDKDEPNNKKVTFELEVVSGMDSKQISELLATKKIISHADDLNDWLTVQNLHRSIQVGKHTLTSEMTIQSIADTITK